MPGPINIISSGEIDKLKWDTCIANSNNSLIYAYSFYLAAMADNWSGLIINDYAAVMPLPWRKKWGIKYSYHPAFIQQLGFFGNAGSVNITSIQDAVIAFIKYGDVFFNYNNHLSTSHKTTQKTNYVIDLSAGYTTINDGYKKDLNNNLTKALKQNTRYETETDFSYVIDLFKNYYAERSPHITDTDYNRFKHLCFNLEKKKMLFIRKAVNEKKEVLAIALLLKDARRIYNIMNATTQKGRDTEANHFLLDNIIREFAGQSLIFDFEGSELPGVKNFYEKFGAFNQPYFHWHFNKLLWPFKLMKK